MIKRVTREIHKFLELHVLDLQNNKINIANRYLKDYEKYIKVLNFLNSYIKTVEKYIDEADIAGFEQIPPFVIIGSTVELQDISSRKKRTFIITESDECNTYDADSYDNVSFISDFGESLLFKEVGQILTIKQPDNERIIKIEKITYDLNL